jgi:hypothetical protein
MVVGGVDSTRSGIERDLAYTSGVVNGTREPASLAGDIRRFSTADWILAGTALFIICNGMSVCIGWWLRIPTGPTVS